MTGIDSSKRRRGVINHTIDKNKDEVKKNIGNIKWYENIFEELGPKDFNVKAFLRSSYICKSEINCLCEHFSSLQNIDLNIEMQIFPVNIK